MTGGRPRRSASQTATSARTTFLEPRNVLATWRPGLSADGGRNARANHTPGLRSVTVAMALRPVFDWYNLNGGMTEASTPGGADASSKS